MSKGLGRKVKGSDLTGPFDNYYPHLLRNTGTTNKGSPAKGGVGVAPLVLGIVVAVVGVIAWLVRKK